ncbi:MAG: hypothetical protein Aurels2KO_31830 [Aureliella sp.]
MTKIIVITCAIVSIGLVSWFFGWIAMRNTGSDQIVTPTVKITAAILAGVVFFAVSFLSEDDTFSTSTRTRSIYHDDGEFLDFSKNLELVNSPNGWGYSYLHYVSRLVVSEKPRSDNVPSLQITQGAFVTWLAARTGKHWQSDIVWDKGFGHGGFSANPHSDAEPTPQLVSTVEVLRELSDTFTRYETIDVPKIPGPLVRSDSLSLPSNSTIKIVDNTILISGDGYSWTISFEHRGGNNSGIGFTRLGQRLERDFHDKTKWNSVTMDVSHSAVFSRWTKDSIRTIAIKDWIEETAEAFERDFGFDGLRDDLESSLETMQSNWMIVTPSTGYEKGSPRAQRKAEPAAAHRAAKPADSQVDNLLSPPGDR